MIHTTLLYLISMVKLKTLSKKNKLAQRATNAEGPLPCVGDRIEGRKVTHTRLLGAVAEVAVVLQLPIEAAKVLQLPILLSLVLTDPTRCPTGPPTQPQLRTLPPSAPRET